MSALDKFKQKMADKRRAKEIIVPINEVSLRTVEDVGCVLNTITRSATRRDFPEAFSTYCRQRYLAVVNSLNFSVNDTFLDFNKPTRAQLLETPISVKDCLNDFLTLIYEPTDKSVFVDKDKVSNNLRLDKMVGHFQFHDTGCKLRFFRKTSELDCMSSDDIENLNAKVLNNSWMVEPYYIKLAPNFLDQHLAGEALTPELHCIVEDATPSDKDMTDFLNTFLEILTCVLFAIKTNLNRYCRKSHALQLQNVHGQKTRVSVSVLQYMKDEIVGLNDQEPTVNKQKPIKAPAPRKARVKTNKRKK